MGAVLDIYGRVRKEECEKDFCNMLSQLINGYKKLGFFSEKSSHSCEFQIGDTQLKAIKGDRGSFIIYIEGDLEGSMDKIQRKGSNICKKNSELCLQVLITFYIHRKSKRCLSKK
jgi:rhs family protein